MCNQNWLPGLDYEDRMKPEWSPGLLEFFACLGFFVCLFVCFLGLQVQHVEVPRLRAESELQLLAYTTVRATLDP